MVIHYDLGGWPLVALQAVTGLLSLRNYQAVPRLQAVPDNYFGRVTIIIPARDEAAHLPALLASLKSLDYPDTELMVVDDESRDGSGRIAESFGARVIRVDRLPHGWAGKCFACWTGAKAATGEWLLFTDADTVHAPESLSRALSAATSWEAGLLSLLPSQRCDTFWERLLLPYAFAGYFAGAWRINSTAGVPVANGQYMLFRRQQYARLGGHAAVSDSLIEDVALAHLAQHSGVKVVLLRAEDQLVVRMYQSLGTLWQGFSKNAARFLAIEPLSGLVTAISGMASLSAVPAALRARSSVVRVCLLLTPAACLLPWLRRYNVPSRFALMYPIAAFVFQAIACDSLRRLTRWSSVSWKGRQY